jgi:hypothetical protein
MARESTRMAQSKLLDAQWSRARDFRRSGSTGDWLKDADVAA